MNASDSATTIPSDALPPSQSRREHTSLDECVHDKSRESLPGGEERPPWTVTIVGLGNTGSQAALLLARLRGLRELRLVDFDRFEARNIAQQNVASRRMAGVAKVHAIASAIRRVRPDVLVQPILEHVENVPPGIVFGATAVFSNLDGPASRRYLTAMAWRFGTPVVDCGVAGEGRLLRVSVFVPESDTACYTCGNDPTADEIPDARYPCTGDDAREEPAPTNAPAWLGAAAASFQLAEFENLVAGGPADRLIGKELMIDARFHRHYVSCLPRNPRCPFAHEKWMIEPLASSPGELSIAKALTLAQPLSRNVRNLPRLLRGTNLALQVPTKQFATRMQCEGCGQAVSKLRLRHRLTATEQTCVRCKGEMRPVPDALVDRIYPRSLGRALSTSMYATGFRDGDLFSILDAGGNARHFMLAARYHSVGPPRHIRV